MNCYVLYLQKMSMQNGSNKKAIVVGATSGIGKAVVAELSKLGWEIGIAGRRQGLLQEIQRKNLQVVATEQIDINADNAGEKLTKLIGKTGGMDLYFHSSGIGFQNPGLDLEKELATVSTNALGFTRMVNTAFHYFEAHPERRGHIAVISSIARTKGLGAAPAYSSSKRFVSHYVECLCQLCHIKGLKHICITDIRPGFVATPLLADGGHYPLQLPVDKVAHTIVRSLLRRRSIVTIDWRYRLLVFFWRMVPRWLWVRMKIQSK